jgi:hypothetical protein
MGFSDSIEASITLLRLDSCVNFAVCFCFARCAILFNSMYGVCGLLASPLCGAALTFFAAAKKVSKESGSNR